MSVAKLVLGAFNNLGEIIMPITLVWDDTDPTTWCELVQSGGTDYRTSVVSERCTSEVDDLFPVDVDAVMGVRERTKGALHADMVSGFHAVPLRRAVRLGEFALEVAALAYLVVDRSVLVLCAAGYSHRATAPSHPLVHPSCSPNSGPLGKVANVVLEGRC